MKNIIVFLSFILSLEALASSLICQVSDHSPGHLGKYRNHYTSDWMKVESTGQGVLVVKGRGIESVLKIEEAESGRYATISYFDVNYESIDDKEVFSQLSSNLSYGAGKFYRAVYQEDLSVEDYRKICPPNIMCDLNAAYHRKVEINCRDM